MAKRSKVFPNSDNTDTNELVRRAFRSLPISGFVRDFGMSQKWRHGSWMNRPELRLLLDRFDLAPSLVPIRSVLDRGFGWCSIFDSRNIPLQERVRRPVHREQVRTFVEAMRKKSLWFWMPMFFERNQIGSTFSNEHHGSRGWHAEDPEGQQLSDKKRRKTSHFGTRECS